MNKEKIMKNTCLALMLCFMALHAEPQYLIDSKGEHGGFFAPTVKLSPVNDDMAMFVGARAGWILAHTVSIGFAGYAMVSDVQVQDVVDSLKHLQMAYGGMEMGLTLFPDKLIHIHLSTLFAMGALHQGAEYPVWGQYDCDRSCEDDEDDDYDEYWRKHTDAILVLEPTVELELNVSRWMRIGAGVGYRKVWGADKVEKVENADLRDFTGSLSLKFGWF
jgi:hypothetical protein